MAESSTVTILRNKVAEIQHRISAYEREIELARKNLVAVQMTLAVFQSDPNAPYHAQRPVSLSKLFRRHELPGVIFKALKEHPKGLDTRELAIICLRHRELNGDDVVLRRSMAMKIFPLSRSLSSVLMIFMAIDRRSTTSSPFNSRCRRQMIANSLVSKPMG